jgi:hypothetical protein
MKEIEIIKQDIKNVMLSKDMAAKDFLRVILGEFNRVEKTLHYSKF